MEKEDAGSGDNKSSRSLPRTPRVCSRILDYYEKFGYKRDLAKYLRIYSPEQDNNQSDYEEKVRRKTIRDCSKCPRIYNNGWIRMPNALPERTNLSHTTRSAEAAVNCGKLSSLVIHSCSALIYH